MKIKKLIERDGYKNDTVRICEFLGFEDTEQLKVAEFFSQEETYSSIGLLGIALSNNNLTWRRCKVNNKVSEVYSVDNGYKIELEICDSSGYGNHLYYQSDFLSLLKEGFIIHAKENDYIKHIKWIEPINNIAYFIHEADVIVKEN